MKGLGLGLGLSGANGISYGSELVSNGTFDTDTTGWTPTNATLSVVGGVLRVTNSTTAVGLAHQAIAVENGSTYAYSADVIGAGAHSIGIGTTTTGNNLVQTSTGAGTKTGTFVATATTIYVNTRNGTTVSGAARDFDNISIKKVL